MLELGRSRCELRIVELMMRDSLHLADSDIKIICDVCQNSEEDKILITHGTDKMVYTARILGQSIKNKTIVLTGAIIPYAFGSSDGMFNLGSALAFVQTLPCGVYITMNGKFFHHENVRKNKNNGNFEEKTECIDKNFN
jgi:L-asparaginase